MKFSRGMLHLYWWWKNKILTAIEDWSYSWVKTRYPEEWPHWSSNRRADKVEEYWIFWFNVWLGVIFFVFYLVCNYNDWPHPLLWFFIKLGWARPSFIRWPKWWPEKLRRPSGKWVPWKWFRKY